jgi:ferrous iron transport protein B
MENGMEEQVFNKKRLSELTDSNPAIITKVLGHGAFRKRITEMGFVSGTSIKLIKYAPLKDPIEYELLGYHVSLRRSEAELIEVVTDPNATTNQGDNFDKDALISEPFRKRATQMSRTINIALVGNPNCGKTSLFNHATGRHEKVGNYSGVTVDTKMASVSHNGYTINITDLPGTYSISEYTPEELYVRKHIFEENPDIILNVIDASNLERNLYLTTQLIAMNIKMVVALNMFDELERKGDRLDYDMLGKMLGIPFVPTNGRDGAGLNTLFDRIIEVFEERDVDARQIQVNYGSNVEKAISVVKSEIEQHQLLNEKYCPRFAAIKLLEGDKIFIKNIAAHPDANHIIEWADKERAELEREYGNQAETVLADARYGFIRGALKETFFPSQQPDNGKGYKVDKILTHKWLGIPAFIFFMWLMFQATFTLGQYPMDWIEAGVDWFSDFMAGIIPEGTLHDLIIDGIISGVGGVIVFLPNILILFLFISIMEDTGYMARAAFIMDVAMHKIGLHGKSFIPLLMGFGCNVPAIMATRTLENKKDRLLTMLIVPLMSCSARLPVFILLISAFFSTHQALILLSIYIIGIALAVIAAMVFKRLFFSHSEAPFVMELPPYRIPTMRNTLIHMWDKSWQYLHKMGTVILVASIVIWALGHFPQKVHYSIPYDVVIAQVEQDPTLTDSQKAVSISQLENEREAEHLENSYIGRLGHFIEPVIRPLGFDWKIGVCIMTGLAAKEVVVSTMGVLYQAGDSDDDTAALQTKLQQQTYKSGPHKGEKVFSPLVAFSMMLFVLIYMPCIAAITAIKKEGGRKWAILTGCYTTALAWIVAFAVFQIGSLFL